MAFGEGISSAVNNLFRLAITPPRRDPLAIDLDGDGIETVGLPAGGNPILFDHDADGIKTGTGWLKGDDAWLVLDRDGNGRIDSGRELFGSDTLITVTESSSVTGSPRRVTRNAQSGFEALRSLDTGAAGAGSAGYGDGVFDAKDAAFGQVSLWQDLNQDGISQSGELSSLADKGIVAIGLTASAATVNLGNGNTVTGRATVTRSNGTQTRIGSVDLQASNLDLAVNPFYRHFTNAIALTDAAKALPDMQGSGSLRDLREAMSLGTPAAQQLTAAVQKFAGATTRDAQLASLDSLLLAWAGTGPDLEVRLRSVVGSWVEIGASGMQGPNNGPDKFNAMFGASLDTQGLEWRSLLAEADFKNGNSAGNKLLQMARDAGMIASIARNVTFGNVFEPSVNVGLPLYTGLESAKYHLGVLGAFNSTEVLSRLVVPGGNTNGQLMSFMFGPLDAQSEDHMAQAYAALRDSVYGALVVQTRLQPYLDSIGLTIDESGVRFDTRALSAKLTAYKAADERNAILDLVDLTRYAEPTLLAVGYDNVATLQAWVGGLAADSPIRAELSGQGIFIDPTRAGTAANELFVGKGSNNTINAGGGADLVISCPQQVSYLRKRIYILTRSCRGCDRCRLPEFPRSGV